MKSIDLNCDMGEAFGKYHLGIDEEIIRFITSANIACGWHGGDPLVMDRTVKIAVENHVAVGAHPGLPDLLGFGRRAMACTPKEIRTYVTYQIGALKAFCSTHHTRLHHVKPHGALYLMAVDNPDIAHAIAEAVAAVAPDLQYIALAGAKGQTMSSAAKALGLSIGYEAFPDRAYTASGTLQSRQEPGAVIKDPRHVTERALQMVLDECVTANDGTIIPLQADTLCVHGDTPAAVALAKGIRRALEKEGVGLSSMKMDSRE